LIKGISGISAVADSRRPFKVKVRRNIFYPLLNPAEGIFPKSC
jgi:hypothetical protein